MRIKSISTFAFTALALSYPFLAAWALPQWRAAPAILLMLPPTVLNAWAAWIFGRTLFAGRQPMIGTFARIERAAVSGNPEEPLPMELARYTRALTMIWTGLFAAMGVVSLCLASYGEYNWWAIFTGVISYVLMAMLFFVEYMYRRIRFAHYRHAQPFQMMWYLIKAGPVWMRGR